MNWTFQDLLSVLSLIETLGGSHHSVQDDQSLSCESNKQLNSVLDFVIVSTLAYTLGGSLSYVISHSSLSVTVSSTSSPSIKAALMMLFCPSFISQDFSEILMSQCCKQGDLYHRCSYLTSVP